DSEGGVGFANEVGRQLAANGMEKCRSGEPSGNRGEQRRKEQQNQSDANQAPTHECSRRYENPSVPARTIVACEFLVLTLVETGCAGGVWSIVTENPTPITETPTPSFL